VVMGGGLRLKGGETTHLGSLKPPLEPCFRRWPKEGSQKAYLGNQIPGFNLKRPGCVKHTG